MTRSRGVVVIDSEKSIAATRLSRTFAESTPLLPLRKPQIEHGSKTAGEPLNVQRNKSQRILH